MDTTSYYAIGIPLYIVLFGVESAIARARHHATPSFSSSVSNLSSGIGAIVVGLIVGPLLVALYDWTYRSFSLFQWGDAWWPSFIAALVLGDLANYWRHRLEHRYAIFWAVHNVHHTPTEMNLSVGLRHAWLSDTYAFPFYAALPLLGIPPAPFFLAMVTVTLYALFTHSREYNYPSFGVLVTPRTHALHHALNARYVDRNFAAMFVVWDRLFGTYVAPDPSDPPVFGTARGSETHDAALAQWVLIGELLRGAKPVTPPPDRVSHATRTYVIAQLVVLVAFSAFVFGLPHSAWPASLVGSILIVATIAGIGGLLDRRRAARAFEAVRLAVFVPVATLLVWGWA